AAADPQTGSITSQTLSRYLGQRVPKLTERKRYPQIPQIFIDPNAPIVFRPAIGGQVSRPKRRVSLKLPQTFHGTADLYKDTLYYGSWHSSDGVWSLDLEDGLYEVRPSGAGDGSVFANKGLFKVIGDLDAEL